MYHSKRDYDTDIRRQMIYRYPSDFKSVTVARDGKSCGHLYNPRQFHAYGR
ncbi:hypothetical protein [Bacteroides caecigallinarum]|uniref:hypothetical protein n=1 Tax=Bacteroides caecigallinarum TaxID=1411144 RepID=UPI001F3E6782|nr:hypothetical protein [Bacteroides caecigallinarum]MCF2551823.1 hypothetical protein [Bacteroides caecigallinarum]